MVERPKSFKTYEEQVGLLIERGMCVADRERAIEKLRRVNYYRLSRYWYSLIFQFTTLLSFVKNSIRFICFISFFDISNSSIDSTYFRYDE